jgi:putative hydrolase of the HAD superfamily
MTGYDIFIFSSSFRDKASNSKSMKLQAVLFDYGKVLSTPQVTSAHQKLVDVFAVSADVFDRCYWASRHAYDQGRYTGQEYWDKVAADAAVSLTAR